ncbi:MAG: amino acid adenylation domain-containing protein, partial [Chthoniobacterales bacterium]
GGVYVPLDQDYPEERLKYLLEDTKPVAVITDSSSAAIFSEGSYSTIALEAIKMNETPIVIHISGLIALNPAYIMYTSGSTGEPKGVIIPHRAVIRLVCNTDYLPFGSDEVFLQAAPLTFDASTLEIWGALLNGALLVIPENGTSSLSEIAQTVRTHHVTTLWLSAGLFQAMVDEHLDDLQGVRNLLAGGDVLPVLHVSRALEKLTNTVLINGYGPTENTTFTACHTIRKEDLKIFSIPIGQPIANTSVWIFDPQGREVPVGIRGEIFTGGDGLALGYLNNPALTAERFIKRSPSNHGEQRLYRTGDLGRWRNDGTIEFLGRADQQVKIRGFRVEPGEVEAVICAYPGVGKCKVAARGNTAGEKKLVAWMSPAAGSVLDRDAIKNYLTEKLPAYLRPDSLVILDSLPLTVNGKIDLHTLPVSQPQIAEASSIPLTESEQQLAQIWCDLLKLPSVGRDNNFFELGGHSLLGLRLFSRIRDTFGLSLPLTALLSAPTIRTLANLISDQPKEWVSPNAEAILSPVQPKGHLTPFFCIHGGDGRVMIYRHLSKHLDSDRPLLGIESPGLFKNDAIKVGRVEKMAADYLRVLKKRQAHGPYYLGGYSFGGVVAYEMARLLIAEGEKVQFLALFDTMNRNRRLRYNPIKWARGMLNTFMAAGVPARIRGISKRGWNYLRGQESLPLSAQIKNFTQQIMRFMLGRLQNKEGVFAPRPAEAHTGLRGSQLVRAYIWSMRKYHPKPYRGKLTLFKVKNNDEQGMTEDYGWGKLVDKLDIVPVKGEHLTMFDAENIGTLGESVRQHLEASDA